MLRLMGMSGCRFDDPMLGPRLVRYQGNDAKLIYSSHIVGFPGYRSSCLFLSRSPLGHDLIVVLDHTLLCSLLVSFAFFALQLSPLYCTTTLTELVYRYS